MWVLDNNSPSAFLRTITDRRRCKSIPTYSRSTGTFFRRVGVALPSSSVVPLETPRREKALSAIADISGSRTVGARPTNTVRPSRKQRQLLHRDHLHRWSRALARRYDDARRPGSRTRVQSGSGRGTSRGAQPAARRGISGIRSDLANVLCFLALPAG